MRIFSDEFINTVLNLYRAVISSKEVELNPFSIKSRGGLKIYEDCFKIKEISIRQIIALKKI